MKRLRYRWFILAITIAVLIALISGCNPGRRYEALVLLLDAAGVKRAAVLINRIPAPTRVPVSYSVGGRNYQADIYRPGKEARAGLVLIPGAAEGGKDDPRLVAFAETLARGRFMVLVPDLKSLKTLQVGSGNIREIIDAFTYLNTLPDGMPGGRGGICAFSYAAGPAILASLAPEIRNLVGFVMVVGGYHSLPGVLTFFTTGYFMKDGAWRHRTPNEYGKFVFALSNVGRLSEEKDRRLFRLMAERKMNDLAAEVGDLAAKLGPEGRAFYEFLVNNSDPSRVPFLISRLPKPVRDEIAALDLANKDLSPLHARLILVHGLDDDIIPYTESESLARALPQGRAELYIAGGLFHVDVEPGLLDGWRLWQAMDALLRARDGS